jgi:hypothetical protein
MVDKSQSERKIITLAGSDKLYTSLDRSMNIKAFWPAQLLIICRRPKRVDALLHGDE